MHTAWQPVAFSDYRTNRRDLPKASSAEPGIRQSELDVVGQVIAVRAECERVTLPGTNTKRF
jgi:hypothetical protein